MKHLVLVHNNVLVWCSASYCGECSIS